MKSLVAGFLLLASTAVAQDTVSEADHQDGTMAGIGIHGGLNFANFNVTNSGVTGAKQNRTGWLAGLHMEGWSAGVFAVRPEVNYSVKGYEIAGFGRVNHQYLQIPLLFKLTPFDGPFKVYVEAGPAASLHLGSSVEALGTTTTFNSNANDWDFSLIGGLGLGVKVSHALLHVEGRYDYGLKDLDSSGVEVKSRAIQLIAGVTFLSE